MENAYPDADFKKFHGPFLQHRISFISMGMTGRVSEESLKSLNAVLAEIKRILWRLTTTTG